MRTSPDQLLLRLFGYAETVRAPLSKSPARASHMFCRKILANTSPNAWTKHDKNEAQPAEFMVMSRNGHQNEQVKKQEMSLGEK